MKSSIRFGSVICALILLSACASGTIRSRHAFSGERLARPQHIIVHDFGTTPNDVPADSGLTGRVSTHAAQQTPEQIALGRRLGSEVAQELVDEIRAMGLPAARAVGGPSPVVGDLVIKGYFVSIDQGSAEKRMLVGFGEGAADLRAAVEGYEVTKDGLRLLGSGETESASGKTPGMLVGVASLAATGNPIGLIAGGASKVMGEKKGTETIEGAAKHTAKEIGDQLRVKFREQGWI